MYDYGLDSGSKIRRKQKTRNKKQNNTFKIGPESELKINCIHLIFHLRAELVLLERQHFTGLSPERIVHATMYHSYRCCSQICFSRFVDICHEFTLH